MEKVEIYTELEVGGPREDVKLYDANMQWNLAACANHYFDIVAQLYNQL